MRRAVFGGICWAVLTCGCSNYMPITEEEFVSISVKGSNISGVTFDDVLNRGLLGGCIGPSSAIGSFNFICDRRSVSSEYDPDTFVVDEDEFGSFELLCVPPDTPEQVGAHCFASVLDADPGREFRFTVNEYTESKVTMPSVPALTSPESGSKVSVSGDDLVLSWKPLSSGDPMIWMVFPTYFEEGDACYEQGLGSDISFGELDDSGSFVIPKAELPTGLPEGGCPATVAIKTVHEGTINPEIKKGRIVGESYFEVKITLVP